MPSDGVFIGGPMDGQLRVVEETRGQTVKVYGGPANPIEHHYTVKVNPANDGPLWVFEYAGTERGSSES